ncbi:MAG TPA: hypothetical protein PK156_24980 [Polyangium sp.]|nr:hypothetical protein [Polyangium sp.]
MNERAHGQTLERVLAAHGGFGVPVVRARRIMGQVARTLVTLNESGVIRGCLPPATILIAQEDGNEFASVADLDPSAPAPHLGYFAPERSGLTQAPLSWATDVFPFAAILYEILCGTRAFAQSGPAELAHHMTRGPAPSLARTSATLPVELRDRPDLVAALDAHFARALCGDPQGRHPSVQQFWAEIDPILRDVVRPLASGQRPQDEPSRPPNPTPPPLVSPAQFVSPAADKPAPITAMAISLQQIENYVPWETLGPPIGVERLHASILVEDGRAILAAGGRGLYRLVRGAWSRVPVPSGVDARAVRGLSRLTSGELLLFGEPDFCCALTARGTAQRIALPDKDIAIEGAHVDEHGVVLVGAHVTRSVGAVILMPRGAPPSVVFVENSSRLTDVTRLSNGTLVAVGLDGAIVEVNEQGSRDVPWARSGHLYAVATSMFGAAHAVGSGGHAVRIEPSPTGGPAIATLERVQTTRDLFGVAADSRSSAVWAVGADARLLERREGNWVRIPLDPSVTGRISAVHLRSPRVIVLVDDGSAFAYDLPA